MLTEALVFPNIGQSDPREIQKLSLQDRVRLRANPCYLVASDLLKMRVRMGVTETPRDEPDEVQCVILGQQP